MPSYITYLEIPYYSIVRTGAAFTGKTGVGFIGKKHQDLRPG